MAWSYKNCDFTPTPPRLDLRIIYSVTHEPVNEARPVDTGRANKASRHQIQPGQARIQSKMPMKSFITAGNQWSLTSATSIWECCLGAIYCSRLSARTPVFCIGIFLGSKGDKSIITYLILWTSQQILELRRKIKRSSQIPYLASELQIILRQKAPRQILYYSRLWDSRLSHSHRAQNHAAASNESLSSSSM